MFKALSQVYFLVNSIDDKWFTPELPFALEMDAPKTVPCTVADPISALWWLMTVIEPRVEVCVCTRLDCWISFSWKLRWIVPGGSALPSFMAS